MLLDLRRALDAAIDALRERDRLEAKLSELKIDLQAAQRMLTWEKPEPLTENERAGLAGLAKEIGS